MKNTNTTRKAPDAYKIQKQQQQPQRQQQQQQHTNCSQPKKIITERTIRALHDLGKKEPDISMEFVALIL